MCDRRNIERVSRGPRTERCGTPEMQMEVGNLQWPMGTICFRPDKYDRNQEKRGREYQKIVQCA